MPNKSERTVFTLLMIILLAMLFTACGGQEAETVEAEPAAEPAEAVAEEAPVVDEAMMVAVLEKADAFDGTTDQVVSKCASCAMMMDGKAEHAVEVAGYTMHFCNDHCKETFEANVEEAVVALQIPEPAVE